MTSPDDMRACFGMVTETNARILNLDGYGLRPGARASLVVLDAADKNGAIKGEIVVVPVANPIGPPQSCATSVAPLSLSASTNLPITSACSDGRYRYPGASTESPKPG